MVSSPTLSCILLIHPDLLLIISALSASDLHPLMDDDDDDVTLV